MTYRAQHRAAPGSQEQPYMEPWPPAPAGYAQPEPPARPSRPWRQWALWLVPVVLVAGIAAVVLLAVQGGSAAPQGATATAASHAPPGGTAAANRLVCKHYLAQRDHVKNLAQPTLTDAMQFETDVTVDAAQSSGRLHKDLEAIAAAIQASRSDYAASVRVYDDCTK